ncbi:MAG: hypothetical protein ACE5GO_07880, partial [Anaerolineales bacterium]
AGEATQVEHLLPAGLTPVVGQELEALDVEGQIRLSVDRSETKEMSEKWGLNNYFLDWTMEYHL